MHLPLSNLIKRLKIKEKKQFYGCKLNAFWIYRIEKIHNNIQRQRIPEQSLKSYIIKVAVHAVVRSSFLQSRVDIRFLVVVGKVKAQFFLDPLTLLLSSGESNHFASLKKTKIRGLHSFKWINEGRNKNDKQGIL